MKRTIFLLAGCILLCSHDMYLKFDTFFLKPNRDVQVHLYNGTFEKSENSIDRDRMLDVSIVSPNGRAAQADTQWSDAGNATVMKFTTGATGTYVAGVSTKARIIELSAEDFNGYLEHDGILDVLERRKSQGILDKDAREKYAKHVKAIFQVGGSRTGHYSTVLGYPIEFVPEVNPYDLTTGGTLPVRLLLNGNPLADQLVYAGHASPGHSHHDGSEHSHGGETQLRTDQNGMVKVRMEEAGHWYLRTIHMVEKDGDLDYVSNWATLTFELK